MSDISLSAPAAAPPPALSDDELRSRTADWFAFSGIPFTDEQTFTVKGYELIAFARSLRDRTTAALSEPVVEPAAPSDEEWEALKDRLWDQYQTVGYQGERFVYDIDFNAALDDTRAVLTRYGTNPTPIPIAERLPEEGDCDADGRCWQEEEGTSCDPPAWILVHHVRIIERARGRFLPFHALPPPGAPRESFPTPIAPIEALGPGHALPLPAAPGGGV